MKFRKHSQWTFRLMLGLGTLIATVLCVQCVRTYLYVDSVLIPQQAEHEAQRQAGALAEAARSAGIEDPRQLTPSLEHTLESATNRVLWMCILDSENHILAESGHPPLKLNIPTNWWDRGPKHSPLGRVIGTSQGRAFSMLLPLRMPRRDQREGRPTRYVLSVGISLEAVADTLGGLRKNLILGMIAALALLGALVVIALRARPYWRGKYLEGELRLARRVQNDLQPKPSPISPYLEFAASATAADHVGGDFYDIFETDSGKIAIVLGDGSGKGVSAALLVSVLQGAIRSSTASRHESSCERINQMLCERTACERFATLFWGIFDPATSLLRYVNAGHAAPMLVRHGQNRIERLDEGGPVLGLLPRAGYSAGTVEIGGSDTLVLYSDGINEATNQTEEEFGEGRIQQLISDAAETRPAEMCERIMNRVTSFASAAIPPDDRTLLIVRFVSSEAVLSHPEFMNLRAETIA